MEDSLHLDPVPEMDTYQIVVEEMIDSSLSPLLYGLNISYAESEDSNQTILKGQLPDQAALSGLLTTLIDNRYTLLSVERIDHI